MKFLLLKPIKNIYYSIQPNLGLGYLATIILKNGHEVDILDSGKEGLTWNDFASKIEKGKYDFIGIQMFSNEIRSVQKHIEIIDKILPESLIIVGGAHVSGDPLGTMKKLKNIDFGFIGEAEMGIEEFLKLKKEDYQKGDLLKKIPSLVWRQNGQVIINNPHFLKDLSKISFPAWDLMTPYSYPTTPHGTFCKKTPVAPLIVSRGCPFLCSFCGASVLASRHLRYRSIENVMSEILLLKEKYRVKEIHIEDDNFTFKKKYAVDFCREIIKKKLDIPFALTNGVRLDTLDEELLTLLERAGFYSMSVGIEAGSDRILKLMKKNITKDIIQEKIDLIAKCVNIKITGFFIIGYPTETESEILETIRFAKSLKLDKASFTFIMPLPGTEIEKIYKKKIQQDIDWSTLFGYQIIDGLSDIPADKLKKLYKKAMISFYLRPKIIFGLMKEIRTYDQIKVIGRRLKSIFVSS